MMTLSQIGATLATLLARTDGALKAEVESIKATVDGAFTEANAKLSAALTENSQLKASVTELTAKNATLGTELTAALSTASDFNTKLTDACLAGNLLDTKERDAALALPIADKFATYQGALNSAFAKANLPISGLPAAPSAPSAGARSDGTMKRAAYFAMTPQAQVAFIKNGGQITD